MNYTEDKLDEELKEITQLVDHLINKPKFLEWVNRNNQRNKKELENILKKGYE